MAGGKLVRKPWTDGKTSDAAKVMNSQVVMEEFWVAGYT